MPVEIRPEEFSMVFFDADEIRAIVEKLAAEVGLPDDLSITVDIDETTPMGHAAVESLDPTVLSLESGSLEDPKRPRKLNEDGAADVIGRLLFSVRDRLDPAFGEPPLDKELSLPHSVAWQVYCVGRLGRLGYKSQRQRRLYQFRNRHGFTDAADQAFERLDLADEDAVHQRSSGIGRVGAVGGEAARPALGLGGALLHTRGARVVEALDQGHPDEATVPGQILDGEGLPHACVSSWVEYESPMVPGPAMPPAASSRRCSLAW